MRGGMGWCEEERGGKWEEVDGKGGRGEGTKVRCGVIEGGGNNWGGEGTNIGKSGRVDEEK